MVAYTASNHFDNIWIHGCICPNISGLIICLYAFLMLPKIIKYSAVSLFSLILCFATYHLCYFIAEKYFFDKFFYRKSITHGYSPETKVQVKYSDFGKRGQDVENIKQLTLDRQSKTTSPDEKSKFIITIIGDSYVWGTGIKNKDRFATLLEKKLNKITPTKIITVGEPGAGIIDFLRWYDVISLFYEPNIFIFSLVDNDIFIDLPYYNYQNDDYKNIISTCKKNRTNQDPTSLVHSINIYDLADSGKSTREIDSIVMKLQSQAWNNDTNLCVMSHSLSLLPSNKSIYFFGDAYWGSQMASPTYTQQLISTQKTVLDSSLGQKLPKYEHYWEKLKKTDKVFQVSSVEQHPNALANQMYADILYNEITTNPIWRFNKIK